MLTRFPARVVWRCLRAIARYIQRFPARVLWRCPRTIARYAHVSTTLQASATVQEFENCYVEHCVAPLYIEMCIALITALTAEPNYQQHLQLSRRMVGGCVAESLLKARVCVQRA